MRSSARRCPAIQRRLPDGSYLARLSAPYQAGRGYGTLPVRVIEAWVTVTLADGTTRREPWRLVTSLLDAQRYPAHELVDLYHRRWQVETTYFSIKATMLDGCVLCSRSVPGLDQEVYALLTVYQALIRTAGDAAATRPGLAMERICWFGGEAPRRAADPGAAAGAGSGDRFDEDVPAGGIRSVALVDADTRRPPEAAGGHLGVVALRRPHLV